MGLMNGIVMAALGVGGAALSRLLADDIKAWIPALTEHLVERAIKKLPGGQHERFAEEWRSHLLDVPGNLTKLVVAISFLRGAWRIARDFSGTRSSEEAANGLLQDAVEETKRAIIHI